MMPVAIVAVLPFQHRPSGCMFIGTQVWPYRHVYRVLLMCGAGIASQPQEQDERAGAACVLAGNAFSAPGRPSSPSAPPSPRHVHRLPRHGTSSSHVGFNFGA